MTDADDVKWQIQEFRELMLPAVSNGAGARSEINEGMQFLAASYLKLDGSKIYVIQQLDYLVALRDQLELIMSTSMNADLLTAQGNIQRAIIDMEEYRDKISFQIDELDKINSQVANRLAPMIEAVGALLQQANTVVDNFSEFL